MSHLQFSCQTITFIFVSFLSQIFEYWQFCTMRLFFWVTCKHCVLNVEEEKEKKAKKIENLGGGGMVVLEDGPGQRNVDFHHLAVEQNYTRQHMP